MADGDGKKDGEEFVLDVSKWFNHSLQKFNNSKFHNFLNDFDEDKSKNGTIIFDGIEQLTDETFYALQELTEKSKLRKQIRKASVVGCLHLTDKGIKMLAKTFRGMEKIVLDGCSRLTDTTIAYLQIYCPDLTFLSMIGTATSYIPDLKPSIDLRVDGCPIFDPPTWHTEHNTFVEERKPLPIRKLVVIATEGTPYSLIDSLESGQFERKTEPPTSKLRFYDKFVSKGSSSPEDDYQINCFEMYGKLVHMSPFITDKAPFVIMVNLERGEDSPHLSIMQYINAMRAVSRHISVVIMILHTSDVTEEELESISELASGLDYCIKLQIETQQNHIQHEKFNSKRAKIRDFQCQKRFIKSLTQYERTDHYHFVRVNVDTLEMQQYHLQEDSSKNKKNVRDAYEKWESEKGQKAIEMVNSIHKADLSELKSFSRLPPACQPVIALILVLFDVTPKKRQEKDFVETCWPQGKRMISDVNFLSKLMSYDKEGMTDEQMVEIEGIMKKYADVLVVEKLRMISRVMETLYYWIDAMYSFAVLSRKTNTKGGTYTVTKGMEPLLSKIHGICQSCVGVDVKRGYVFSQAFHDFYNNFQCSKKVCTLREFVDLLPTKHFGSQQECYETPLQYLHYWGRCLFFPQLKGKPVVSDIQWFMDLLNKLVNLPDAYRNNSRLKAVARECSLLDQDIISQIWKDDVTSVQMPLILEVLNHFGIILDVPYIRRSLSDPPYYLVPACQLSEKPFLHSLAEGESHTITMAQYYWPKFPNLVTKDTDTELIYYYKFTLGYPAEFSGRLLRELVKLGGVTLLWAKGCLIEKGAVELYILNNMHAAMFSESIEVSARVTKSSQDKDFITHEYLWSVLNPYLLLIEYLVDQYSIVHCKHRIPCRGECSVVSVAHTFSPVEFMPGESLKCPSCNEQICDSHRKLIEGRKRLAHVHFWVTTDSPVACTLCENCITPPGDHCPYNHMNDLSKCDCVNYGWYCRFCGICTSCSARMWQMESALYPAFTSSSFQVLVPAASELSGNLISCPTDNAESGEDSVNQTVVRCAYPLSWTTHRRVEVNVLADGPITVILDVTRYSEKDHLTETEILKDLLEGKCSLKFEAHTGMLTTKDGLPKYLGSDAIFHSGDKLVMEVVNDMELDTEDKMARFMALEIRKNNMVLGSVTIPAVCSTTLICGSEGDKKARVTIHAPTVLNISSNHFDAGAAMIYHTDVGNTWNVGQLSGITPDGELILSDGSQNKLVFNPGSDKILPLCYSPDLHLMVNGEMCKSEEQLVKFLDDHQCMTPQWALFVYLRRSFTDYKPVHSLFCSESIYSYRVLQTKLFSSATYGASKASKFIAGHVFLPATDMERLLYVPSRQAVQNWNGQSYATLCTGSLQSDAKRRDFHFMNIERKELKDVSFQFASKEVLYYLMYSYWCMLDKKLILPKDINELFPNMGLSKEEVTTGLTQILRMGLSACILKLAYNFPYSPTHDWTLVNVGVRKFEKPLGIPFVPNSQGSLCIPHRSVWYNKAIISKANKKKNKGKEEITEVPTEPDSVYNPCIRGVKMAEKSTLQEILESVGRYPNLLHLNITSCEVKDAIWQVTSLCPCLEILELSSTGITELSIELKKLKETLTTLKVNEPTLKGPIPDWLAEFKRLRIIAFDQSLVTSLPEDIGSLPLTSLSLKHCPIRKLPHSFRKLRRLTILKMHGISWPSWQKDKKFFLFKEWTAFCERFPYYTHCEDQEKFAEWFEQFEIEPGKLDQEGFYKFVDNLLWNVPRLNVDSETKTCAGIPEEIFHCYSLKILELQNQAFTDIPSQVGKLRRLDMVSVSHCIRLERIDGNIGNSNLKTLILPSTPQLKTPPKEIVSKGMYQTIVYLKRLGEGSQACKRTKLMFVGLGGAGKTSLMRALMSSEFKAPISQNEAITDGIDISTWTINRQKEALTYSVWDFAGQTLYYNTHQFFLSSRSVYLLMWNTRLGFEHAGLYFWLSSIKCHAPDAPIFVIGTHADKVSKSELPIKKMKERYPSIAGFHLVSSLTGEGVEALLDAIISTTMAQPYIGERIPDAWLKFESEILGQRTTASVLEWQVIQQLAAKRGLYEDEMRQAVQFLHELGSLQHFQNDLLRDKVVINPQWIVDVMACVVSVHNSVIKEGVLRHDDVAVIWKAYPKPLHKWLLHLTEAFDLTFPLLDQPANIVPCLLPQTEPNIDWPDIRGQKDVKETIMEYQFDYLPAGLFNRVQVRLSEFSEKSTMWKTGSLLSKNSHLALIMQRGDTEVIVRVQGTRPENTLLLIHEVFEGLISDSFHGVTYEYQIPCSDCMDSHLKEPTMFSSGVLHSALELKAMFLQCHKRFHTLSISHIQTTMPPDSTTDFDLHLQNMVQDLNSMQNNFTSDAFFLYCDKNAPKDASTCTWVHPKRVQEDLEGAGFATMYVENLGQEKMDDIALNMAESKVVLVFISDEFVKDEQCQRMFHHVKDNLKKPILLLVIGDGLEWQKSDIGMQLAEKVYFDMRQPERYKVNHKGLVRRLSQKTGKKDNISAQDADVFISYCWSNSKSAVKRGEAVAKPGSVGYGDPRKIKNYLEANGLSCWLDIERVGEGGLFEDIAEGLKKSKVMVACISDEYNLSANCQMEFRFAHVTLKLPIIVCVVGTGLNWESTEIGMLSLCHPRINLQINNNISEETLLNSVREKLAIIDEKHQREAMTPAPMQSPRITTVSKKQNAFQELYELAQRKFLRQVTSYIGHKVQFPRLFVVDSVPERKDDKETEEISEDDIGLGLDVLYNENNPEFYFKILCEYEGGWHASQCSVPITAYGEELRSLWVLLSPYMGRVLTILKHSDISLNILQTEDGRSLVTFFEQNAGNAHIKRLYLEMIRYLILNSEKDLGGLKRCHLPSGRILWLCEEHQKLPRVSVLENKSAPLVDDDIEFSESLLITHLSDIAKETRATDGNDSDDEDADTVSDLTRKEDVSSDQPMAPTKIGMDKKPSSTDMKKIKYTVPVIAHLSKAGKSKACVVM